MSEQTLTEPVIKVTEDAGRWVVRANEPKTREETSNLLVEEGCRGFSMGMVFDEKRDKDHAVEFWGDSSRG